MQGKINPLIAVAAGVVIIALAVFFYVRSGSTATQPAPLPSSYQHPTATNHP